MKYSLTAIEELDLKQVKGGNSPWYLWMDACVVKPTVTLVENCKTGGSIYESTIYLTDMIKPVATIAVNNMREGVLAVLPGLIESVAQKWRESNVGNLVGEIVSYTGAFSDNHGIGLYVKFKTSKY